MPRARAIKHEIIVLKRGKNDIFVCCLEHFCDPSDKSHPKFTRVADLEMILYSANNQMKGESAKAVKIGEAVSTG